MGKRHLSRTPCLTHNLLIITCKSYKSGLKLSVSKIPGYYLQWWLCCSSSKIGIFSIFGGVKCALGDSVHHVIRDVRINGKRMILIIKSPQLQIKSRKRCCGHRIWLARVAIFSGLDSEAQVIGMYIGSAETSTYIISYTALLPSFPPTTHSRNGLGVYW